jgi:REP element-mobilizing transposase RayT
MSHSYNKIWIHLIFSTKLRAQLIYPAIEKDIYAFIEGQLRDMGCPVRIINGMPDHVHALFLLNPQKSMAEVVKQVKGSSSHFVNQSNLLSEKFAWQIGYAAFAVSESILEKVVRYIKNQKEHHRKTTFTHEYEGFLKLHGFVDDATEA